ncbi:MAG TPA: sulfur carrier protein ThiS [Acidimicrobiales bacterium]
MSGAADGPVRVTVNGDAHEVAPGTTVAGLVAALGLEPRGLAVAVDGEVVSRRAWPDRPLRTGAQVEVLSIAQGG